MNRSTKPPALDDLVRFFESLELTRDYAPAELLEIVKLIEPSAFKAGEMSEITGEPTSASVQAKTDCVALIRKPSELMPSGIHKILNLRA